MAIDPSLTGLPEDTSIDGTELLEVVNRDGRKAVPLTNLTKPTSLAIARYATAALPKWSIAWAKAQAGAATRPARLLFVGDSKTMGAGASKVVDGPKYITDVFTRSKSAHVARLLRRSCAVYEGFVGYNGASTPAERMLYDPRVTLTNTGGGVRALAGTITSSSVGTFISYAHGVAPVDRFSVLTQWDITRPAFSVSKGSETFTLTPAGATANVASRQEVVFATKDAAAITLTKGAGTSGTTPIIAGVAWDSANPGVEVMNAGVYGITAKATVTPQNGNDMDYLPVLAVYAPDLTVIALGTNDVTGVSGPNVSLSDYLAAITSIATVAKVTGDVIVIWNAVGGNNPANGDDVTRAIWKSALRDLCQNNGYLFLDEEQFFGSRNAAQAAGAYRDGTHENDWAYVLQGAALERVITSA